MAKKFTSEERILLSLIYKEFSKRVTLAPKEFCKHIAKIFNIHANRKYPCINERAEKSITGKIMSMKGEKGVNSDDEQLKSVQIILDADELAKSNKNYSIGPSKGKKSATSIGETRVDILDTFSQAELKIYENKDKYFNINIMLRYILDEKLVNNTRLALIKEDLDKRENKLKEIVVLDESDTEEEELDDYEYQEDEYESDDEIVTQKKNATIPPVQQTKSANKGNNKSNNYRVTKEKERQILLQKFNISQDEIKIFQQKLELLERESALKINVLRNELNELKQKLSEN